MITNVFIIAAAVNVDKKASIIKSITMLKSLCQASILFFYRAFTKSANSLIVLKLSTSMIRHSEGVPICLPHC